MSILIFVINYLAVTSAGVLFHYIHDIFKTGPLVHILGAVNESIWEHLKLAFWPMLISAVIRFILFSPESNYWFAVSASLIVAIVLIPLLYLPVRAMLKKEVTLVSIGLYYVCVFFGLVTEQLVIATTYGNNIVGVGIIVVLIIFFAIFTYNPPKWAIFKDPISGKYGDSPGR